MIIDDDCDDDNIRVFHSPKLHQNYTWISCFSLWNTRVAQLDLVIPLFTATAATMLVKIEQPWACSAPARSLRSVLCVNRRRILYLLLPFLVLPILRKVLRTVHQETAYISKPEPVLGLITNTLGGVFFAYHSTSPVSQEGGLYTDASGISCKTR